MNWPSGRDRVTAHVAGETTGGEQRCTRCGIALYTARHGAGSLWYPGQLVGVTDTGQVRMALRAGHGHPECEADSEPADSPAGV